MPYGSRYATRARSETAVYLALGIDATWRKDVLGLWIEQSEGAKFWLKVFNDIKQRGVTDILIAVVDGGYAASRKPSRQRPMFGEIAHIYFN